MKDPVCNFFYLDMDARQRRTIDLLLLRQNLPLQKAQANKCLPHHHCRQFLKTNRPSSNKKAKKKDYDSQIVESGTTDDCSISTPMKPAQTPPASTEPPQNDPLTIIDKLGASGSSN